MADKKLNIKVGTQGTEKARKKLGGVEKGLGSLGRQALTAGAAFFGARAIVGGMKAVIKLAGEQEQAEKKLSTALGFTSKVLLDQASALQKVTTFGDEAIIGVQASLAAFLDSEEAIKKATEATLDISVAMGMDLKAAGDLVAKTLGSSTNAMSRYGIEVEGAVGSTDRLESLTGNVARLFGGQAKAQAETMAGAMQQASNAMGDAGEAIGSLLSPAVVKLSGHIKEAAEFWHEFFGNFENDKIEEEDSIIQNISETIDHHNKLRDYRLELFKNEELLEKRAIARGRTISDQRMVEHAAIMNLGFAVERLIMLKSMLGETPQLDLFSPELRGDIEFFNIEIDKVPESIVNMGELTVGWGDRMIAIWAGMSEQSKKAGVTIAMSAMQQGEAFKSVGKAAISASLDVVVSAAQEAVAKYIARIFAQFPFPLNLALAAGASAAVGSLMQGAVSSMSDLQFAEGGIVPGQGNRDTVPAMLTPGEVILNQAQQENLAGGMGGITVNISAPLVDETVVESIIPAIEKAQRLGLA